MRYLTNEELNNFSKLKMKPHTLNTSGTLFLHEDKVYKLFLKDISASLLYLKNIPFHKNILPIEDIVLFEDSCPYKSGYVMSYKMNAKTFCECYSSHLSYPEKVHYIQQMFQALHHIHHYIVLGDIHGDNMFIHEHKAYLYDLDSYQKPNTKSKSPCKYYITKQEKKKKSTYTDLIKLYLESYFFFLEEDFSHYINLYGYYDFAKILLSCHPPKEMENWIFKSFSLLENKKVREEDYIPDAYFTEEIVELKRKVQVKLS